MSQARSSRSLGVVEAEGVAYLQAMKAQLLEYQAEAAAAAAAEHQEYLAYQAAEEVVEVVEVAEVVVVVEATITRNPSLA